jgi:hypothetical protein
MSDTVDEVAASAREKHDEAVIAYLEAIRGEIHKLPGRIFGWFFGAAVIGWLLWWIVVTAP